MLEGTICRSGIGCNQSKIMLSHAKLPEVSDGHLELEEDEEEDIDFNPFLKETLSPEASSSLSSENEGLGADLMDDVGSSCKETNLSSPSAYQLQSCIPRDLENDGEEAVMQTHVSTSGNESEDAYCGNEKKKKSVSIPQKEIEYSYLDGSSGSKEIVPGQENNSSGVTDVNEEELPHSRDISKPVIDLDEEEDAICRRTRARYSLANFTLEELETFLQESDDDDEFQNVDDEQEYQKFLAAVLQGGDNESHIIPENANVDDEDEENDADFEIEIEEALDSDLDETTRGKRQKERYSVEGRRPETRLNKRQKTCVQNKKKILGQVNRPLRPLLPFVPNAQLAPFPALDWQKKLVPDNSQHCFSSPAQTSHINGFTPNQIGQLHCLIHEHVQLLVQVFSLCVLDPSRQSIAVDAKRMILEVVHTRDEVSSRRKVPYPGFCFRPPYIQPSVSDGLPKFHQVQYSVESSVASDTHKERSSVNDMPVSLHVCPSNGRNNEDVHRRHADSLWVPLISGPVISILDVAPLSLVGRYMTDVSSVVQQYQQCYTESKSDSHSEREPMFPLPNLPAFAEASNEVSRGSASPSACTVSSALPGHQQPKKTLAATLVESTKKQSVALVPKEIGNLAQRFYPLFNSALFPHKPPLAAVANRVLFTDAEDELLATGLMECNNDWKAIQQRFLPCKSKHQIFVRQKNRCSSKAPENSIKAVRRMKTSPLTAEEKARIHEGLRVLKLDWMSVWKFIVPYRDPSLLPRQWRIAQGTQRSYTTDPARKEKRRLYESQRRKSKAAALANWQTASEKEDYMVDNADEENQSGKDNMDDEDEAYVHEAFLADWRPDNSGHVSSELALSSLNRSDLQPGGLPSLEGAGVGENPGYGESLPITGYMQNVSHVTHVRYSASYTVASNHFGADWMSKSSKSQVSLRPYRLRRSKAPQLVKLAPDLPPVNLPSSVRVISQSAFKSYHCGSSNSTKVTSGGVGREYIVKTLAPVTKSGTTSALDAGKNRNIPSYHDTANGCPQGSGSHKDQCVTEGKGPESDLQMHPLLFQTSEDGRLPYSQMNCSSRATSTFNFLPGDQFEANLNPLSKSQHLVPPVDHFNTSLKPKEVPSSTCTIDFHPLLQKTDTVNSGSVMVSSACLMPVNLESFGSKSVQLQNPCDSVLTKPLVSKYSPTTVPEPASPCEKANELDLEIHLSSTSRKEKVIRSRNVTEDTSNASKIDWLVGGSTTMDYQKVHNTSYQISKSFPAACTSSGVHVLGVHEMGLASDNAGDQSLPEIVMEQEELSDSEEEIGDHVEFECEEMADSEGDNSDSVQLEETRNKEVQQITAEDIANNGDCNDQQHKARIGTSSKGNICTANNSKVRSSMRELVGKSKDAAINNKLQVNIGVSPIGKSLLSRPRRVCRKITPSTDGDKDIISCEITRASKKPRRRVYRNDCSGNSGGGDNSTDFPPNDASLGMENDPKKAMDIICLGPSQSREVEGNAQLGFKQ